MCYEFFIYNSFCYTFPSNVVRISFNALHIMSAFNIHFYIFNVVVSILIPGLESIDLLSNRQNRDGHRMTS